MRFILGLLIGAGIGFAVSVIFAPEKAAKTDKSAGVHAGTNGRSSFQSVIDTVRKQMDEAMTEARKAQKDAESELTERYRRTVARSGE